MKQVYRVLAFLIAAGVILQAAAIAYAVFAMFEWVGTGGTIDKALIESENPQIGGITGFKLHQLVGVTVLPLVAVLLLISSFFARIPGGIRWGLIVFVTTLAQSLLGIYAHHTARVGWLHGGVALVLFICASFAALRVDRALASKHAGEPVPAAHRPLTGHSIGVRPLWVGSCRYEGDDHCGADGWTRGPDLRSGPRTGEP